MSAMFMKKQRTPEEIEALRLLEEGMVDLPTGTPVVMAEEQGMVDMPAGTKVLNLDALEGEPRTVQVDINPLELEQDAARAQDTEARNRRVREMALRQMVGGITRTKPTEATTALQTNERDLLAQRRQSRLDALKDIELGNEARRMDLNAQATQAQLSRDADKSSRGERDYLLSLSREERKALESERKLEQSDKKLASDAAKRAAGAAAGAKKAAEKAKAGAYRDATAMRREYAGLPEVKTAKEASVAFSKIQQAAQDPSAAGDLSLIFAFMKVLDPGSTVREGEFQTAAAAAGVDQRLLASIGKVQSGQRLTPEQRADFIAQAKKLHDAHQQQRNTASAMYRRLAEKNGFDPADVVGDEGAPAAAPSQGAAPAAAAPTQGMVTLVDANGDEVDMPANKVDAALKAGLRRK